MIRKLKWQKNKILPGSLTIEASLIVPMIIFCMAMFIVTGFRQATAITNEIRQQQMLWMEDREKAVDLALILRGGNEVEEIIDIIQG